MILTKFVCCADSDLLHISKLSTLLPGFAYVLATMPTVLRETLGCCITLHCAVCLGLIMSWPSMFLFGSAILHANNPLKSVLSEFVFHCKKAGALDFIQAARQLVLSALIGNFANKVTCFSRIASYPIAKSHVIRWSVREHDTTWVRLFFPFVFEPLRLIWSTTEKSWQSFSGGAWPLRPHSGCAPLFLVSSCSKWAYYSNIFWTNTATTIRPG